MARKRKSALAKSVKKLSALSICLIVLFFVIGVGAGYFTVYSITKDDTFEVLGQKNITLNVGDEYTYEELGVKAIAYGKDISGDVKIEYHGFTISSGGTAIIDTSAENEFYVVYTFDDGKFGKITKIRFITIVQEVI